MRALVHQNIPYPEGSSREIKHNTVPWNLFLTRSGAVAMSPACEGPGASVEDGVGSNLTAL